MQYYDIIIVGGGLAGLTAALDLVQKNHSVLVFEKQQFPHHKVCGEYVSNEICAYLDRLGIDFNTIHPAAIEQLQVTTIEGKSITAKLPLGGFGISRYAFDNLLYEKAIFLGVSFVFEKVTSVQFQNDRFEVIAEQEIMYTSKYVIGAFGKRSNLDKSLQRSFMNRKSEWLGVKAHFSLEEFPSNLVALHSFKGGYGGLSKTETGAVNFCYLASYKSFQAEKNVEAFNANIVAKNPYLRAFLNNATPIFNEPLSIAQISFDQKEAVEEHILMCGDSAGLIHPLCGNGMAMAIHSAKLAAELIHKSLEGNGMSRQGLETAYKKQWNKTFRNRLWAGRQLQALLLNERLSNTMLSIITKSPKALKHLIKLTHGEPIL